MTCGWKQHSSRSRSLKGSFSLSKASTGRDLGLAHTSSLIAINTSQSCDYRAKVFLMPQPRKKRIIPMCARQSLTGHFSQGDVRSILLIVWLYSWHEMAFLNLHKFKCTDLKLQLENVQVRNFTFIRIKRAHKPLTQKILCIFFLLTKRFRSKRLCWRKKWTSIS